MNIKDRSHLEKLSCKIVNVFEFLNTTVQNENKCLVFEKFKELLFD